MRQAISPRLAISTDMLPPNSVRSRISAAKNALISVERFTALQNDFAGERIAQIYARYEKKLAASADSHDDDDDRREGGRGPSR